MEKFLCQNKLVKVNTSIFQNFLGSRPHHQLFEGFSLLFFDHVYESALVPLDQTGHDGSGGEEAGLVDGLLRRRGQRRVVVEIVVQTASPNLLFVLFRFVRDGDDLFRHAQVATNLFMQGGQELAAGGVSD